MSEPSITIQVRRVHLWGATGLIVGLLTGFLIGHSTASKPRAILYGVPPTSARAAASTPTIAGAQSTTPKKPVNVSTAGRPARGPANAKVTMVEFVDYQCPFCGQFERDTMPQIEKTYGSRIRIVSRQFPLSIHPNAFGAALAMECAFQQGKFWQLHDRLFHHQDDLGPGGLIQQARAVGLDPARMGACEKSSATKAAVNRDITAGRAYGVKGTPTIFINGRPIEGALPYAQFKSAIDAAFKR